MPQYVISYIGGNPPATPEAGKQHFARYMDWMRGLGQAVVSPMNPLKGTSTIKPDGSVSDGGITAMSGFTIIETDSKQSAIDMAKNCPFLELGGSLEVSELAIMPSKRSEPEAQPRNSL